MTVDLDAKREYRVKGDIFCAMVEQIRNKSRNITISKRYQESTQCDKLE